MSCRRKRDRWARLLASVTFVAPQAVIGTTVKICPVCKRKSSLTGRCANTMCGTQQLDQASGILSSWGDMWDDDHHWLAAQFYEMAETLETRWPPSSAEDATQAIQEAIQQVGQLVSTCNDQYEGNYNPDVDFRKLLQEMEDTLEIDESSEPEEEEDDPWRDPYEFLWQTVFSYADQPRFSPEDVSQALARLHPSLSGEFCQRIGEIVAAYRKESPPHQNTRPPG